MCCVRLERCRSTAGVAAEVAAGVLPEGRWTLGAVKLVYCVRLERCRSTTGC